MDLKQFDELLHDAEVKLKRLKALYEQWFTGIERIEPLIARKDLDRSLALLSKEKPRNTAARFRLQQLSARYAVYATYWQRIGRQIEEGSFERIPTHKRVIKKEQERRAAQAYELDLDQDVDLSNADLVQDEIASALSALEAQPVAPAPKPAVFSAFSPFAMGGKKPAPKATDEKAPAAKKPSERPVVPKPVAPAAQKPASEPRTRALEPAQPLELDMDDAPPVKAPKPAPPAPVAAAPKPVTATFGKPKAAPRPEPAKDELRSLYDEFVAARRKNNERADVAYEKMADSIQKMKERLREKHGDKKIGFEVVVQDGKVGLKPKIG